MLTGVGAEPFADIFTLDIPGPAGGVVVFFWLLQLARSAHNGNTNNVFFILTVLLTQNHNRAKSWFSNNFF